MRGTKTDWKRPLLAVTTLSFARIVSEWGVCSANKAIECPRLESLMLVSYFEIIFWLFKAQPQLIIYYDRGQQKKGVPLWSKNKQIFLCSCNVNPSQFFFSATLHRNNTGSWTEQMDSSKTLDSVVGGSDILSPLGGPIYCHRVPPCSKKTPSTKFHSIKSLEN